MNTDPAAQEVERLREVVEGLNKQVVSGAKTSPHVYAYEALKAIETISDYLGGGVGWNERVRDIASLLRDAAIGLTHCSYHGVAFVYGFAGLLEDAYLGNDLHLEVHGMANKRRIEGSKTDR